ncbi:hypothetical protein KAR91_79830, partial [Candidatus Pacearchaeota archaeon]|nr:hypothetical protein [Candidatus Pacearchaeota archaeon]
YVDSSGQIYGVITDAGGTTSDTTTATVSIGEWFTVVGNFDRDGNLSITLNGSTEILANIASRSGAIAPGNLAVGRNANSAASFWGGRLDNVAYIDRLVTPAEGTWLHNLGEWRQYVECGVAGNDGSTLTDFTAFWEFDDADDLGADSVASTDFTPQGTPTQGQGINYNEGIVSRWEDQGSDGNHATQLTLSKRPALITNMLNGWPVVSFDAVDDYLGTALAGLAAATIYFVGKINAVDGAVVGVEEGNNKSYIGSNASDKFGGGVAETDWDTIASDEDPGTYFIGAIQYSGDTEDITLYHNSGLEDTETQSGDVSTAYTYTIGGLNSSDTIGTFADAQIAEVIIYNRVLTDAEKSSVDLYLSNKYAITLV